MTARIPQPPGIPILGNIISLETDVPLRSFLPVNRHVGFGRGEGEPADNAARFVDWLQNIKGNEFDGVKFAVFGCGNSDRTATFQKILSLCDDPIHQHGGRRLMARGSGDASTGEFFQTFDNFDRELWKAVSTEYSMSRFESVAQTLQVKTVDIGQGRATALRQADALLGRVIENRVLTKGGPVKRHIEFELPEGTNAGAGDYLSILPQNPTQDLRRVLARFGLSDEEEVILSSVGPTSLPAETVLARRLSMFEISESHTGTDIELPIGTFLQMLPSMRVRQYSISSSPLWNPRHVTITLSILDFPSLSGKMAQPFLGVGSNYLASLMPGNRVQMTVRPSSAAFHPPENPATPVVMFCSGAGIAPMCGFIQERAAQKASGREVGDMLLFFGCRSPELDFLYPDGDLAQWINEDVVDVRPAFSRLSDDSEGCKYVQHRIWKDRADVLDAYKSNASFFTCGSSSVAKGIKATLVDIFKAENNIDDAEAAAEFERITKGRYATDIFE
ncbi:hypothetical protein B0H17DRAFT_1327061 [Mycena rosella]|uniref:FAD-binding FR-type domain-containing protein n=1 Tax=Mycena rosella TaxID=1033263 RepID=A0AAD7GQH5_MYCRO|nr:hypothetical protein B0H17DRAFT_1327061 [Mycena rosella]